MAPFLTCYSSFRSLAVSSRLRLVPTPSRPPTAVAPSPPRGLASLGRSVARSGKTAIRTLLGPAYQKLKKVPTLKDEDEAKALMARMLPQ